MNWPGFRKPDPLLTKIGITLEHLEAAISAPVDDRPDPDPTSIQLVERVDSLENRFEELRGTVLRHLQSASQRLKRQQDLQDDIEEEQPSTLPIQFDAAENPENDVTNGPADDLQWAISQMRKRGESAII